MTEQPIFITEEGVLVDGEIIPFEEYNFEDCPFTEELLGIILDSYPPQL